MGTRWNGEGNVGQGAVAGVVCIDGDMEDDVRPGYSSEWKDNALCFVCVCVCVCGRQSKPSSILRSLFRRFAGSLSQIVAQMLVARALASIKGAVDCQPSGL